MSNPNEVVKRYKYREILRHIMQNKLREKDHPEYVDYSSYQSLESQLAAERVKCGQLRSALVRISNLKPEYGAEARTMLEIAQEAIKKYGESGILKTQGEKRIKGGDSNCS